MFVHVFNLKKENLKFREREKNHPKLPNPIFVNSIFFFFQKLGIFLEQIIFHFFLKRDSQNLWPNGT